MYVEHIKQILVSLGILISVNLNAGDIELGKVKWLRNLKEAQVSSKTLNKPILILFQEVPGCSTCRNYGSNVLSHPLIVEAIETNFVPLCIYNNKGGNDREALELFSEPSWNNPVIRIVNSNLNSIADRLDGNYTNYGLISTINGCLQKLGTKIPGYMVLLEEEFKAEQTGLEHATIGMYCFWAGEKIYGQTKGVISTSAGYMNGSEVVEIAYDSHETSLQELIKTGVKNNSADMLFTNDAILPYPGIPVHKSGAFRIDTETKYYLNQSDYKYIPMTSLQATRANSLLAEGKSCEHILTPRQLNWYSKIRSVEKSLLKNQIGRNIKTAWYESINQNYNGSGY